MKHMKKSIALFLAVLMTLSVFSVVGFAEGDTDPATAGPFTVKFFDCAPGDIPGYTPQMITDPVTVEKGGSVEDPYEDVKNKLKYPAELDKDFYKWEFTGWSHSLENVQSNLTISPRYNKVGKQYIVIYHNFDGSEISRETCIYGDHLSEIPTPTRSSDPTFNYVFAGWAVKKGVDPTKQDDKKYLLDFSQGLNLPIDEKLEQVPGQPDYIDLHGNGTEPITVDVYAYFTQHYKAYTLSLTVLDSSGAPVNGAKVQVLKPDGKTSANLDYAARDEEGNLTGGWATAQGTTNAQGQLTMNLHYETEYIIQVSNQDTNEGMIKKVTPSELKWGVTITLTDAAGYHEEYKPRCTCACHSFIGGLWITALNVMHYLFKVKYVCCYDMYATHGDKLAYAA